MKRIYPARIGDIFRLSFILDCCLQALALSPMHVRIKELAYDSRIQEHIFHRLLNVRNEPEDAENLRSDDFHILFANVLFRYPTLKIWEDEKGEIVIEI